MTENRIEILKDILLRLHHGADAKSVQEDFDQHFTGVSALEISMMEHELMGTATGITFEDVMSLCNVHANLFKGAISDVDVPDAEQEGHPSMFLNKKILLCVLPCYAFVVLLKIMKKLKTRNFIQTRFVD